MSVTRVGGECYYRCYKQQLNLSRDAFKMEVRMVIRISSGITQAIVNSACICENTCKDHPVPDVSALINMKRPSAVASFFDAIPEVIILQAPLSPVSHTAGFFLTPTDKRSIQSRRSAASASARGKGGAYSSEANASKTLRSEWKITGMWPQDARIYL